MSTKKMLLLSLCLIGLQEFFAMTKDVQTQMLLSGIIILFCIIVLFSKKQWIHGKNTKIAITIFMYQAICCCFHGNLLFPFYINILETLFWPSAFVLIYYVFSQYQKQDLKDLLLKFFVVVLFVNCFVYLKDFDVRMNVLQSNDVRSNLIFYIVCLLPITSLIEETKKRYFLYLIIVAFSVFSFKRTAMLATFVSMSVEFFFNQKIKKNKYSNIFLTFFFLLLGAFVISSIESQFDLSVIDRFAAISEDGGSGRDLIYLDVWNHYIKLPIEYLIFGRGHNGVRTDGFLTIQWNSSETLSAHTDFLEVFYDYGLIGSFLYFYFIWHIVKVARFWKKIKPHYFRSMIVSLVVFLLMSTSSHLILYPTYFVYIVVYWSFMCSEKNKYYKLKYGYKNYD